MFYIRYTLESTDKFHSFIGLGLSSFTKEISAGSHFKFSGVVRIDKRE